MVFKGKNKGKDKNNKLESSGLDNSLKILNHFLKLNEFKDIDMKKIKEILSKKILIIGAGGVGSNLALFLSRSKFKNITIVDNDTIEISNLDRQAYFLEQVGMKKVEALKEIIKKIDEKLNYIFISVYINEKNYNKILNDYDLIVDCSDNFKIRYLINEFCEKNDKNWLYVGASRIEYSSYLFYGKKKEFKKIFRNPKEVSTSYEGILPITPIIAAALAYTNIIKYFLKKEIKFIKVNLWNDNFFVF